MRAVRYHGPGDIRLDQQPDPQCGPDDVVIAPAAVGICGTDLHIAAGEFPLARPPVTLGHEFAGRIVAVGGGGGDLSAGDLSVGDLSVGDLVTVEPHRYCGRCAYCRLGQEHLCDAKRGYGVRLDGGMADLVVVPAAKAFPVPTGVSPTLAALTEPAACCLHGIDRLQPKPGLPVIVFGCGPAGLLLVRLAALSGLSPVVAVDGMPARRATAARVGADVLLDAHSPTLADDARRCTGGAGFPFVIDAVGASAVLSQGIRLASRGARILLFGVAPQHDALSISPYDVYIRELTLLGSCINPFTHSRAVGLLPALGVEHWNVASFDLADHAAAFDAHRNQEADKVLITPTPAQP